MDRQGHDYMGYNQPNNIPPPQQQHQTSNIPPPQHQQQPFNFHPQQQFPPPGPHGAHGPHGPPFIPQHPYQYLPPQYPHAPPPHFHHLRPPPPANFPPPHLPFPPPPAPPPSDLELQKRIDKLIEYSFKNGPEFEAMIREKQKDNPEYSFLFLGEGHNYYRYKLWLITTQPPQSGPHFNHPPFHQPMVGPPIFHNTQFRPPFKGLSKPLPSDIEMEFNNVLNTLTGTKESIKGAKNWFMQRSPFIPALAEALRDRVFLLEDSERQLHIIYLVNDILFESLQRRINPHELDNEAIAFKPVLGSMLARVYHNPQNKEENQSKLLKIVQFWASKEVYDQETVRALEHEMINSFQSFRNILPDSGLPHQHAPPPIWQQQPNILPNIPDQDKQFHPSTIPPTIFPVSSLQPPPQPPLATATSGEKPPPYPLFPPGLIPGMVRKMQIGSGVPYSPLSPLDIPTIIPPSTISSSEILDSVSKFFKEIGEVNPSVGPTKDEYDDNDDYESERKGGACIPPPSDGEYGGTGSGRLGLGASGSESNESTQYDDVYSSYRKQRSSTYHVSMSARTGAR